ncbi:MAG: preprotein translocase subunit SecG [Inquilinus sp.]|nr:preprotein translocase subunit SecG [Inquilinus sp.]
MQQVVLVIHLIVAVVMVGLVLIQRSEGGGLGMGGGGGGMGSFMSVRGTANLLTRATGIAAGCFMVTSITLAILAGSTREPGVIVDEAPVPIEAPAESPGATAPLSE